jgi:UDP-N-acetylmuramate--alanine ligase
MTLDLNHIRHIYFLGIGGIGMSALARYFSAKGISISGYDKTPTSLTAQLIDEGMEVHFEDEPERITKDIDLVIYTPAVPIDLGEYVRVKEMDLPVYKRAEVLGMVTRDKFTVAVAGTHGKTTITSMIAHMLVKAGMPVTALLGGISKNYSSNYITTGKEEIMVVEADEYDRSFLHLHPDVAVISSMDADHLDIYRSREKMLESFRRFSRQIRDGGLLIFRSDLRSELQVLPMCMSYSADTPADYSALNIEVENGKQLFTLNATGEIIPKIRLGVPGRHNIENALAAAAACIRCGVAASSIREGLETYHGVSRRFDIRVEENDRVYIDDYAHHPRELSAFINSVRELYPGKKATGIFQPHLFSRTRDFADGFAHSLEMLDEVILLDIYPAREKPIPGVTSCMLLEKIHNKQKRLVRREELLPLLDRKRPELLLTIGAGDIDMFVGPIEKLMRSW